MTPEREPILTDTKRIVLVLKDLLREADATRPYTTYADVKADLKARLRHLRLPSSPEMIASALDQLEAQRPVILRCDAQVVVEREPVPVVIGPAEAARLVQQIRARAGIATPIKTMVAVRELSPSEILEGRFREDRAKAHRVVQQQILETAERVAALEAAIETEPS